MLGGCPNGWVAYVGVQDVDATVEQAVGLGGNLHVAPRDISGGRRFAVLQDPQGAFIAIYSFSAAGDADWNPSHMDTPGQVGWHELATSDMPAAWDFYSTLFGWKLSQDMELPPEMGGTYRLFNRYDDNLGGIGGKPAGVPPHWQLYLRVSDLEATRVRSLKAGRPAHEIYHGVRGGHGANQGGES